VPIEAKLMTHYLKSS